MKEMRMPWPVLRGALMKHVTIIGMLSLEVRHINPRITPGEAKENE